jgi:hypothetical protein
VKAVYNSFYYIFNFVISIILIMKIVGKFFYLVRY